MLESQDVTIKETNVSVYGDLEFLKTKLKAILERKSEEKEGDENKKIVTQRILVTPTEKTGNVIDVKDAIEQIKGLINGKKDGGKKSDDKKLNEGELKKTLSPYTGGLLDSIEIQLNQAFLYSISKGECDANANTDNDNEIKPTESDMEYAVNVELKNIDSILDKRIKGDFNLFNISSIGFAMWNTNRKKVLEKMNICSIDEYLAE